MKAQTVSAKTYYACKVPGGHLFPNAAEKHFTAEKLVDILLSAAITLSVVVIGVVLLTM